MGGGSRWGIDGKGGGRRKMRGRKMSEMRGWRRWRRKKVRRRERGEKRGI